MNPIWLEHILSDGLVQPPSRCGSQGSGGQLHGKRQALKMLLNTSSFAQAALHAGGAVASDPKKREWRIAMIKWSEWYPCINSSSMSYHCFFSWTSRSWNVQVHFLSGRNKSIRDLLNNSTLDISSRGGRVRNILHIPLPKKYTTSSFKGEDVGSFCCESTLSCSYCLNIFTP